MLHTPIIHVLLALAAVAGGIAIFLLLCCPRLLQGKYRNYSDRVFLCALWRSASRWPHKHITGPLPLQGSVWIPPQLREWALASKHPSWYMPRTIRQAEYILILQPSQALDGLLHTLLLDRSQQRILHLGDILPDDPKHPSGACLWTRLGLGSLPTANADHPEGV